MSDYYEATAFAPRTTRALEGDAAADVAIIGAGITGCSAALHLAERGYKVALLEAEGIGYGASGRNGGQVLPGFSADQPKVRRIMGAEAARRLWELSMEAVDLLHAQIQRFGIPCDPVRGYLHAATRERHARELREWAEELAGLGVQGMHLLEGAALRARLASPRYRAALFDPVAGHIHPLNYTLGLARAAMRAGAEIYTGTRIGSVTQGRKIRLQAARGSVTADFLLLCGNAYLGGLMRPIASHVMPVGTYIIATEPRDDVPGLIPGNEAVADLNFVLDYYRRSPDDRMLFGGRVSYSGRPPRDLPAAM
ncbi:MAG TPA: FAD-binding oxidoreductase, partial [Acetobacteraceae bacterium]|nr:FAD-binding oxidoreductase [Acetobacteraceae bacterium]